MIHLLGGKLGKVLLCKQIRSTVVREGRTITLRHNIPAPRPSNDERHS